MQKYLLLLIFLALSFSLGVSADEIVLKNGQRFKGRVLYQAGGEVGFQHENGTRSTFLRKDISRIDIQRTSVEKAAKQIARLKGQAAAIKEIEAIPPTVKKERRRKVAEKLLGFAEIWRTGRQTLPCALKAINLALEISPDLANGKKIQRSIKEQWRLAQVENAEPPSTLKELYGRTPRVEVLLKIRNPGGFELVKQRYKISDAHVRAVKKGVQWLLKNQEPDGLWDIQKHGGILGKSSAVTAVATLALMGSGISPAEKGENGEKAALAIEWLSRWQTDKGNFPDGDMIHHNLGNFLAARALVDAVALGARKYKPQALLALKWTAKNQLPEGGWGYNQEADYGTGRKAGQANITMLSFPAFSSVAAASFADLHQPGRESLLSRGARYFSAVTSKKENRLQVASSFRERFGRVQLGTEGHKATSLAARLFFARFFSVELEKNKIVFNQKLNQENLKELLSLDRLKHPAKRGAFPLYTVFAAAFEAGPDAYAKACEAYLAPILSSQREDGSFPAGKLDGDRNGGDVWATAVTVMALQVPWLLPETDYYASSVR